MTLDEFIERFNEYSKQPKIWIVDPMREAEFINAFKGIERIVKQNDANASIQCKINEFHLGESSIEVDTDWLTVKEVEAFCKSIANADNFEIYPKINETIHISIMFYGIYKRIC